jgi:nucleotide-binding universal stress UspA family protein
MTMTTRRKHEGDYSIVVGFDFSDLAHLALDHGFAFAATHAPSAIHVIGVVDEHRSDATYQTAERFQRRIEHVVGQMMDTRNLGEVDMFVHTRIGKPAEQILQLAAEVEADVICVGSHGHTGLSRLVLGSVSERVLRGADCPVIAARAKTYAETEERGIEPEPPCPKCETVRRASAGSSWWCTEHAADRLAPRRHSYRGTPRQSVIRDARAHANAPFGTRPGVLDDHTQ